MVTTRNGGVFKRLGYPILTPHYSLPALTTALLTNQFGVDFFSESRDFASGTTSIKPLVGEVAKIR